MWKGLYSIHGSRAIEQRMGYSRAAEWKRCDGEIEYRWVKAGFFFMRLLADAKCQRAEMQVLRYRSTSCSIWKGYLLLFAASLAGRLTQRLTVTTSALLSKSYLAVDSWKSYG